MPTTRTGTATVTERPSRSHPTGTRLARALPTPPHIPSSTQFQKSPPLPSPHSRNHRAAFHPPRAAARRQRAAAHGRLKVETLPKKTQTPPFHPRQGHFPSLLLFSTRKNTPITPFFYASPKNPARLRVERSPLRNQKKTFLLWIELAGEELVDDLGDAAVGLRGGDAFGVRLDFPSGVAHGEAEGGAAEHGDVVDIVADGDDLAGEDLEELGDVLDAGPLGGDGGEEFDDLAVEVGGAHGVPGDLIGEARVEAGFDEGGVGGVDDDTEADNAVGAGGWNFVIARGVHAVEEQPFFGGVVEGGVVGEEVGGEMGIEMVDEGEGRVALAAEEVDGGLDEGGGEGAGVEGVAVGHVGDEGAGGEDAGAGEFESGDDAGAFVGDAAGADGDVDAGGACGAEGVEVAVVDFVVAADEGAVEIAGDEFPVGI
jgi:hypothetical protein